MRTELVQNPLLSAPILRFRPFLHLIFWAGYVAFFALMNGQETLADALRAELLLLPVKVAAVYITLYVLIARLLFRGFTTRFGLALLALLLGAALLQRVMVYYVVYPLHYPDGSYTLFAFVNYQHIVRLLLSVTGVVLLASVIHVTRHWYQDQQRTEALAKEKLSAELKFLKAQIHPHFLFNTLNNLYALTLKQSGQAPEVVLRLSGLLNYMLYDASASHIALSREIECIHNYLALEKIRYGEDLDITFDVTGNLEACRIAPLLLLPFVENSFKHGVSSRISDKWVLINLHVNPPFLTLKVENSRPVPSTEKEPAYAGGIGLRNVRRRLHLLYPGRHDLEILAHPTTFLITLQIDLS
ncbi:MAG: sensor histidine kinase [Bacteroidetes bacterium]|nr:MAG: sensor histidine kinase [Bacteroidota bacterium]